MTRRLRTAARLCRFAAQMACIVVAAGAIEAVLWMCPRRRPDCAPPPAEGG